MFTVCPQPPTKLDWIPKNSFSRLRNEKKLGSFSAENPGRLIGGFSNYEEMRMLEPVDRSITENYTDRHMQKAG